MEENGIHNKLFTNCFKYETKTVTPVTHRNYHYCNRNLEITIKNYEKIVFHHIGTVNKIETYYNIQTNSIQIVIYDELEMVDRMCDISNIENITSITCSEW